MSESDITLRILDHVSDEHWEALTTWSDHVFPEEGIGTEWIDGNYCVLAFSEGQPVGHIGFGVFDITIDDFKTKCIGIGGVVVVPAYQGLYIPKKMFSAVRKWRDANHSSLPLALFCPTALVRYYKKHSFIECAGEVYYLQKGSYIKSKFEFLADHQITVNNRILIPSNPW